MPRNAKNWCMTSYEFIDPADLYDSTTMAYIVSGLEVCPTTQRNHYQAFVQMRKKHRMSALKKHFGSAVHFEEMRGTAEEAAIYCKKDGNYQERGTLVLCAPNVMTRRMHAESWFMSTYWGCNLV